MKKILIIFATVLLFYETVGVTIEKDTVWNGQRTIDNEIKVSYGKKLTIVPGSQIKFVKGGKIICNGIFSAKDSRFVTENYPEGTTAIYFLSAKVNINNCVFKDFPPGAKQYKAAIESCYGSFSMTNCTIENCAPVQIVHNGGAVIKNNYFKNSIKLALHIYNCRAALIKGNVFDAGPKSESQLLFTATETSRVVANCFYGRAYDITVRYKSHDNIIIENRLFQPLSGIHVYNGNWSNQYVCNLVLFPKYNGFNFKSGSKASIINCVCWGAGNCGIYLGDCDAMTVRNSVFANCKRSVAISDKAKNSTIENNMVWGNKKNSRKILEKLKSLGNYIENPLFVDPERSNFRPQTKKFGHPKDSPLLNKKVPIGLYPAKDL